MDPVALDYFRSRERAERAAAKRARSASARGVHQELAQRYAALVRQAANDRESPLAEDPETHPLSGNGLTPGLRII